MNPLQINTLTSAVTIYTHAVTSACYVIIGLWIIRLYATHQYAPRGNYPISVFRYIDGKKYVLLCNFHLDILGEIDDIADKLITNYHEKNWNTKVLPKAYNSKGKEIDHQLMRSIWGYKPNGSLNKKRDGAPTRDRYIYRPLSNNPKTERLIKRKALLN